MIVLVQSCMQAVKFTFQGILADELSRVRQTPGDATRNDGYGGNSATGDEDTDMLWEYDPMATQAPSELADVDYQELMLAMEHALYDDLQADMRMQGNISGQSFLLLMHFVQP